MNPPLAIVALREYIFSTSAFADPFAVIFSIVAASVFFLFCLHYFYHFLHFFSIPQFIGLFTFFIIYLVYFILTALQHSFSAESLRLVFYYLSRGAYFTGIATHFIVLILLSSSQKKDLLLLSTIFFLPSTVIIAKIFLFYYQVESREYLFIYILLVICCAIPLLLHLRKDYWHKKLRYFLIAIFSLYFIANIFNYFIVPHRIFIIPHVIENREIINILVTGAIFMSFFFFIKRIQFAQGNKR